MTLEQVLNEMRQRIEDECAPGIENVKTWADVIEVTRTNYANEIARLYRSLDQQAQTIRECDDEVLRLRHSFSVNTEWSKSVWKVVIDEIVPSLEILSEDDEARYPVEAALALDRARIRRELADFIKLMTQRSD